MEKEQTFDRHAKLRELILYICGKSEADERFGKVKLCKLLFYSDFTAFLRLGKSITGEEYQALQQGPAPREIFATLGSLESQNRIAIRSKPFFGRTQHKIFALESAQIDGVFSGSEIAIIDEVIETFWKYTATEISNDSHGFIGWKLAKEGETIPYEMVLFARRQPTIKEREYAKSLDALVEACHAGAY